MVQFVDCGGRGSQPRHSGLLPNWALAPEASGPKGLSNATLVSDLKVGPPQIGFRSALDWPQAGLRPTTSISLAFIFLSAERHSRAQGTIVRLAIALHSALPLPPITLVKLKAFPRREEDDRDG